jgi:plasmid maintenance system antidote protein VapI
MEFTPKKRTIVGLAKSAGTSKQWLHGIIAGRGRPSWDLALILSRLTDSDPATWMSRDSARIGAVIDQYLNGERENNEE